MINKICKNKRAIAIGTLVLASVSASVYNHFKDDDDINYEKKS
jgi:hypothetical protein